MNIQAQTEVSTASAMEAIIQSARSLYSLPAVAAEVIELTDCPKVDARALKNCIEVDPALTAKILRVVNSSLFGLSREVVDLNQAIALLGTTPLKLLVLGFSLPENLFSEVAREQLSWYWNNTLARAVAAREISEQLWNRSGDDVFLVGLLQDVGVLVLLGELKESYAQLLDGVIDKRADLKRLEVESLGFDHSTLSAALLNHWNMPELLVQSILEPRDHKLLQKRATPAAELARILHLSELLAELVAQNRLCVLPDLLEAGEAYCGLDKESLHQLVVSLQPKVRQLADVLSLDLGKGADYSAIVTEAHSQMSSLVENVAEPLSRFEVAVGEDCEDLLGDVANLRSAVDRFLIPTEPNVADKAKDIGAQQSCVSNPEVESSREADASDVVLIEYRASFLERLTLAVGRCRSSRQSLSILLLNATADQAGDARYEKAISEGFETASHDLAVAGVLVEAVSPHRRAFVLEGYDRQEAVGCARAVLHNLDEVFQDLAAKGFSGEFSASAGVATVSLPVKNFPPIDLVKTAERCLAAARSTGTMVVKSLEIY